MVQEEAVDSFDGMPAGFKYLAEKDRGEFAKKMFKHQLKVGEHQLKVGEQQLKVGEQQLRVGEQQLHESRVALKRKRCNDLIQSCKSLQELGVAPDERTFNRGTYAITLPSSRGKTSSTVRWPSPPPFFKTRPPRRTS